MKTWSKNRKAISEGFTLVELLVVVALIAIVATLGISLMSGTTKDAAEVVNSANIKQLTSNVGAYMQLHGGLLPNGFDSLIRSDFASAGATYSTVTTGVVVADNSGVVIYVGLDSDYNGVIDDASGTSKGVDPAAWQTIFRSLTVTQLTSNDVVNLATIGITNVYDCVPAKDLFHGDYSYVSRPLRTGDPVCIVDPYDGRGGRSVYFDFGVADAMASSSTRTSLLAERRFMAFGVGPNTTMIGDRKAGIQEAPKSSVPMPGYYNRYLLVVKMPMGPNDTTVDFAGILDPQGKTSRLADGWATRTGN